MKKLVIQLAVDLDDATFAKICMQCGGFNRIPGTDLFQLPEFASVNLSKILEKGVREEKPAPLPGNGTPGAQTQEVSEQSVSESSAVQGSELPPVVSLGEAAKDPTVKERATGIIGGALGLRGSRSGRRSKESKD